MNVLPSSLRSLARQGLFLAAIAAALPASAQTAGGTNRTSWWQPGSGRTLIGLNLGRSDYQVGCGSVLYACDDRDRYMSLYGRNMANDRWGSELGLVHLGEIDRAGGSTRAYGLNLSMVGQVPLAQGFSLYGKLGAILGRTRVTAAAPSGLGTGDENSVGLSVGAGVSWDFSPKMSAVLEWDRYHLKFAGSGRDAVNAASIGLQYRY